MSISKNDLAEILMYEARKLALPAEGMSEAIAKYIPMAVRETSALSDWLFKEKIVSLTVSTTATGDSYNMEDNEVARIVSVLERQSVNGTAIMFKLKTEFDRLAPVPSSHAAGLPRFYTIFHDGKNLKVQFLPSPSVTPIEFLVMTNGTTKPSDLPAHLDALLMEVCKKYLMVAGTPGYVAQANSVIPAAVGVAEGLDQRYAGGVDHFLSEEQEIKVWRPWVE